MTNHDEVTDALARVVTHLPDGEVREGQQEMARAVVDAIENNRHAVIRAGTGTGKSLGYLIPAIMSKKRVIIATATKALQDQLASNDLPLVEKGLGRDFSFEVLKGRSNYLCAQKLQESHAGGVQTEFDDPSGDAVASGGRFAEEVEALLEWAKRTPTGDRSELDKEPDPRVWSAFSVAAEECPGAFRCPSGSKCFAEAARSRASGADVVVVNLHLVGSDLASAGAVLPEHDVLVVDEAHEFESVLSSSLGGTITSARIRAIASMARQVGRGKAWRDASAETLSRAIDDLVDVGEKFDKQVSVSGGTRLEAHLEEGLSDVVSLLSSRLEQLERAMRARSGDGTELDQEATRALLGSARLRELVSRLITFDEADVAWVEGGARPAIVIAPIDVSGLLKDQLFATRSVVLTSATVSLDLAKRLGASSRQVTSIDVGSPFDFENHALLYCAAHLPDRRQEGAEEQLFDELGRLIDCAGGRTLALFTSWSVMTKAVTALRTRLDYPIIAQGEQSKPALLEAFKSEARSCLFATMSFWQGVDVPGPTLSLVAIDRIPFPRPDDPLLSARRQRIGQSAFREIDLPRAANLLAQGAGRLIRTATDRGVVAVLDSRLATASYRWDLIRALPPMKRTKDPQEVGEFLRSIRDDA